MLPVNGVEEIFEINIFVWFFAYSYVYLAEYAGKTKAGSNFMLPTFVKVGL